MCPDALLDETVLATGTASGESARRYVYKVYQQHLLVPRNWQHYLWEWRSLKVELTQDVRQTLSALKEQPLPQSQLPLRRLPLLKELSDQKVLQQNLGGDQLPPQVERQAAQRILLLLGRSNPR